jgi:hypothetical protein
MLLAEHNKMKEAREKREAEKKEKEEKRLAELRWAGWQHSQTNILHQGCKPCNVFESTQLNRYLSGIRLLPTAD